MESNRSFIAEKHHCASIPCSSHPIPLPRPTSYGHGDPRPVKNMVSALYLGASISVCVFVCAAYLRKLTKNLGEGQKKTATK